MGAFPRLSVLVLAAVFGCPWAQAASDTEITRLDGLPGQEAGALLKSLPAIAWKKSTASTTAQSALSLQPLADARLKALQTENSQLQLKRVKVGVNRNPDTEANTAASTVAAGAPLTWEAVPGGQVARFDVTSPGAAALRVALQVKSIPDNAELRVAGSDQPDRIFGAISGKEIKALRDDSKLYWTPVTNGATQILELYIPVSDTPSQTVLSVASISHLFTSAAEQFDTNKVMLKDKGDSESCEVDVACKYSSLGDTFKSTASAVARMVFSDSTGTYTCSGTLLNNTNQDRTPYFWSAAHCISTQSAASTLNTYWFYEAASCGGSQTNSNYQQLTGGAALLHVNTGADTLLLRLNNSAPGSAAFAGWDASSAFSSGSMVGIHHPSGDVKKVSTGSGQGKTCDAAFAPDDTINNANLSLVSWSQGATEGGSSGSGVFTLSSGKYYLRGGLTGGSSSCSATGGSVKSGNADCYSQLSLVYSDIKQYLSPSASTAGPSRDYTGQWVNSSENAWGLTVLMNFPSNTRYLFVPWYIYDSNGKAAWYIFQGDNWSATDSLTADVLRFTGPAWGVLPYNNSNVSSTKAGTATLTFTSATTANFSFTVDGSSRSMTLTKLQ